MLFKTISRSYLWTCLSGYLLGCPVVSYAQSPSACPENSVLPTKKIEIASTNPAVQTSGICLHALVDVDSADIFSGFASPHVSFSDISSGSGLEKSGSFLPAGIYETDSGKNSRLSSSGVPESNWEKRALTGRVTDAQTGEGIPLVSVFISGTTTGTACDDQGYYRLDIPSGQDITMIFSAIGYTEKKLKIQPGQENAELNVSLQKDMLNLGEVVITGTRTEKTIKDVPVLTRLIPAVQLERNDFETIMDALTFNIPGLQFNSDPRGDNIKIQGLENKYILILVDGERLSNTPGGPIDFDRLSTSNIKQIEVIKGAASALYGSSAIGMIVNIITKTPQRKVEGWVKGRYSKFNDILADGAIGLARGKFTSQTLYNYSRQDGYDLTPESPESYTKNPSSRMTAEEKLTWKGKTTMIHASGTFYMNEINNPPESTKNTHYLHFNKTFRAGVQQKLGEYNEMKFTYYGDFYTRKTIYEELDNKSLVNATSHVQTLRLTDVYTLSQKFQLIGGAEFNWNRDFNEMQYGTTETVRTMNDLNGFVQFDWQLLKLLNVVGGFRFTHHSTFGNAYTPKISVMFDPGNWRFRAGYSRGFKAPDATELYSDFMMGSVSHNIGNPNLKAENSDYYSFSVEYMYNKVNASVELYNNLVKNKIQSYNVQVADPATGELSTELRYDNVDKARIRGAEVSVDYFPLPKLYLHGGYSFTDAQDMRTKLQLKGNTRHAISCTTTFRTDVLRREMSLSLSGRWTSQKIEDKESTTEDQQTGEQVTVIERALKPAYSLWKITLQYTPWKKENMALVLSTGVQNLFNYKDLVTFTTYDPGIRAFGSVLFKF